MDNLDRQLGDVLIMVRRTCFEQVLGHSGLVVTGFRVSLGSHASGVAELPKPGVRARSSANEIRIVGALILRHDALDVSEDNAPGFVPPSATASS
jgi:hypothetical protein